MYRVFTIGAKDRDFSTMEAFVNSIPSDHINRKETWIGICYNDYEDKIKNSPYYPPSPWKT